MSVPAPEADRPIVSLVIPSRNEAFDIAPTLEACLAMHYPHKEILVVDDSTDDTPRIVAGYAQRGVRLLHRERNKNGCCGARNLGMREARGEILVLLNADARPEPDFLDRVLTHYREGADYLVVGSVVQNPENPWARFVLASLLGEKVEPRWSEGFSCRRAAAESVGFIPGDYPVPFCRDNNLADALRQAGYTKHYDRSIPMAHVAPSTLREFWGNRVWRGTFSAPTHYYVHRRPLTLVAVRELLRAAWHVLLVLLVVPPVWRACRLARRVPPAWRSAPGLLAATLVQEAAEVVGGLRGLRELVAAELRR